MGVTLRTRVPNLWDVRGLKVMFSWVHLYQWGDAIDVKGDADTKRLGTPVLEDYKTGIGALSATLLALYCKILPKMMFGEDSTMLH